MRFVAVAVDVSHEQGLVAAKHAILPGVDDYDARRESLSAASRANVSAGRVRTNGDLLYL